MASTTAFALFTAMKDLVAFSEVRAASLTSGSSLEEKPGSVQRRRQRPARQRDHRADDLLQRLPARQVRELRLHRPHDRRGRAARRRQQARKRADDADGGLLRVRGRRVGGRVDLCGLCVSLEIRLFGLR